MTYELRLNVANCLFILPNPPRTNPEVAENLLFFVPIQVQEGHEKDVGHMQDELMHHEQEAGVQFGDDRCTWVQNEIQRMSTDLKRQGAELSGLHGDFQRGHNKVSFIFSFFFLVSSSFLSNH